MSDTPEKRRPRPPMPRGERDISDITQRLQSQVNDLVERVTGMRQVKRQYLTLGLTVGILVGIVLGVLIGMLMHAVTEDSDK